MHTNAIEAAYRDARFSAGSVLSTLVAQTGIPEPVLFGQADRPIAVQESPRTCGGCGQPNRTIEPCPYCGRRGL